MPSLLDNHSLAQAGADSSSHLSADSFAARSHISLRSTVSNSSLIDSQITESVVLNSRLLGSTLRASVATDASIRGSNLVNVVVTGLYGQFPEITGVNLANCTIEGAVRLVGPWSLDGAARIHEGEWYRPPRFKAISSANGVLVTLTECVSGRALIACRCHDMRRWQASGPRLGRMLGWPAELVREAWLTFEEWLDDPNAGQSDRR